MIFAKNFARNYEKNNTSNIKCLVDVSFVPTTRQPIVLYWRLSDFTPTFLLSSPTFQLFTPMGNSEATQKKPTKSNKEESWWWSCHRKLQCPALTCFMRTQNIAQGSRKASNDLTYYLVHTYFMHLLDENVAVVCLRRYYRLDIYYFITWVISHKYLVYINENGICSLKHCI